MASLYISFIGICRSQGNAEKDGLQPYGVEIEKRNCPCCNRGLYTISLCSFSFTLNFNFFLYGSIFTFPDATIQIRAICALDRGCKAFSLDS